MANLQKIIKVTQEQYDTLKGGGTIGDYTGLDENYIYFIEDNYEYLPLVSIDSTTTVNDLPFQCRLDYESGYVCCKTPGVNNNVGITCINSSGYYYKFGNIGSTLVEDILVEDNYFEYALVENLARVATSGSYNDLSNKPTIPTSFNLTDDVLDGSANKYAPYTSRGAGHLYTGTTAPSSTNRLNYDGYFYATKLYSGGNEVKTTDNNYYPTRIYSSGLQISNFSGAVSCELYVPYASNTQAGVVSTAAQTFAGNKTFNGEVYVGGKTTIYTSNEGGNFRTVAPDYDTTSGELDFESNVLRLYALYGTAQTGLQEEQYTEIRLHADKITMSRTLNVTGAVNASSHIATSAWYNANGTAGASWEIDGSTHTLNVGARVKAPSFKQSDSTKQYVDLVTGQGVNFGISGASGAVYYLQLFATLDQVYPVGSIYFSTNSSASPASLFGGTWEKLQGGNIYLWKTNVAYVVTNSSRHSGNPNPLKFDYIHDGTTSACAEQSKHFALTSNGVGLTISQLDGSSWGSNWGGYGTAIPNNLVTNAAASTFLVYAWKRIA